MRRAAARDLQRGKPPVQRRRRDRTEKTFGKHPTQKPVRLLNRIIRASTKPSDLVLDPLLGMGQQHWLVQTMDGSAWA